MYTKLVQVLTTLKGVGAVGIKTSFEDEGAHPKNVRKLRNVTHKVGLDLNVKIGGAEAKTDFKMALDMNSNGIVAPMIESPFALSKFTSYAKNFNVTRGINIESKQGVENLDSILDSEYIKDIDYICIGRTDLAASYNQHVLSPELCETVTDTLMKIKSANIQACMGGSFDSRSYKFVKFLHENELLERVETRYIMFNMDNHFIENFEMSITEALNFEREYMNMLYENGIMEIQDFLKRRDAINERLSQQIDYL
jgi:hypothetical protein